MPTEPDPSHEPRVIAATFDDPRAAQRTILELEERLATSRMAAGPHAEGVVVVVHVDGGYHDAIAVIEASGGRIETDVPESWL